MRHMKIERETTGFMNTDVEKMSAKFREVPNLLLFNSSGNVIV